MKIVCFACLWVIAFVIPIPGTAQEVPDKISLIPQPVKCVAGQGHFAMSNETAIVLPENGFFRQEAGQLNAIIKNATGYALPVQRQRTNRIRFVRDSSILAPEGYRLTISEKEVVLTAGQAAGIFMGIQTIRQLLPAYAEKKWIGLPHSKRSKVIFMPAKSIEDEPAFSWRGMHLDVSRHFFSIGYLRKFIDVMALYKMNKLHLHLTDDQGWRIEIKKYPKLTGEGAWRIFNNQDSACMNRAREDPDFAIDPSHIIHRDGKTLYGGYYTQEQMKGLVAYAAKRHITIIPEIDMPGHMMAAINAYPFLTCNGVNKWGALFTTPICPCNEASFTFAENVFNEIMAIFPSEYIHIGGDEVDRSDWGRSDACKELMKKEGIADLSSLQSYFIRRMEKFFISKGRHLIGWDEILEGGISPTAIVMYWRSWVPDAPLKAVRNGNAVIMTPGSPLYFDRPPDRNSLYEVYHFDPVPKGLSVTEARSIIGAQANNWTENIPSENRAEYMYMPRMTALAERLWTNRVDDYDSYRQRLQDQYPRLDALKIHYRLPDLEGMIGQNVFVDSDTLRIKKPLPVMEIRYTSDGSAPRRNSKLLSGPLIIDRSGLVRVEAFAPGGLKGDIYDLHFQRQELASPVDLPGLQPGLTASYTKAFFSATKLIGRNRADSFFVTDSIAVPSWVNAPSFGIIYSGYIHFPSDGIYNFYLTSDDGAVLKIAGRETVNNDGLHSAIEKSGQVAVRRGYQPFELEFIEGGGGYTLKLEYSKGGAERMAIPSSWFGH